MSSSDFTPLEIKPIRCAIYTRKSTSEGSEQDFTSLDAQRESGESYVTSQKSLGWIILDEKYDDYGFTGGNMERPALKKLISDINEGKIDCVVVYKVDRLSRSLLDFTKILQLFDSKNVTFVSVTQHFNTNSSMGRLTLNILLSFAQFEREIISERTKDKLTAAKKKGKFVGGRPSLGYDVDTIKHRLVTNPQEAEIVRDLFNIYLKEKSGLKAARIANEKGYLTKKCTLNGKPAGGITFSTGTINYLLNNFIYTGKVIANGVIYPGEHEQIISDDIFNKVQKLLQANRLNKNPRRLKHIGLLTRMFFCKTCQKSIYYSYVRKKNYNYACYLCVEAQKRGYNSCLTGCLNAQRTEDAVIKFLRTIVPDKRIGPDNWNLLPIKEKREIFQSFVKKVEYNSKSHVLSLTLTENGLVHDFPIDLKIPIIEKKETIEDKIKKEPKIRQLLLLAHQIQDLLDTGKAKDLKEIAKWLNVTPPRAHQFLNLLRLAPIIQEEIILSNDPVLFNIPEHRLRRTQIERDSIQKIILWNKLKNNPL
jgi:DNA invertase Pin-like site-specific DNA recombinase